MSLDRQKVINKILKKYNDDKLYTLRILESCSKTDRIFNFNGRKYTKSEVISLYCYFRAYIDCDNKIHKELNRDKNRLYRQRKKINEMFKSGLDVYFLTLTFTNDYIKLKFNTRRRYIVDYLKSNYCTYIANVDYGDQNNREHYHALVTYYDDIKFVLNKYVYGIINCERVNIENEYALSEYITKLSKHSNKLKQKSIYSRNI